MAVAHNSALTTVFPPQRSINANVEMIDTSSVGGADSGGKSIVAVGDATSPVTKSYLDATFQDIVDINSKLLTNNPMPVFVAHNGGSVTINVDMQTGYMVNPASIEVALEMNLEVFKAGTPSKLTVQDGIVPIGDLYPVSSIETVINGSTQFGMNNSRTSLHPLRRARILCNYPNSAAERENVYAERNGFHLHCRSAAERTAKNYGMYKKASGTAIEVDDKWEEKIDDPNKCWNWYTHSKVLQSRNVKRIQDGKSWWITLELDAEGLFGATQLSPKVIRTLQFNITFLPITEAFGVTTCAGGGVTENITYTRYKITSVAVGKQNILPAEKFWDKLKPFSEGGGSFIPSFPSVVIDTQNTSRVYAAGTQVLIFNNMDSDVPDVLTILLVDEEDISKNYGAQSRFQFPQIEYMEFYVPSNANARYHMDGRHRFGSSMGTITSRATWFTNRFTDNGVKALRVFHDIYAHELKKVAGDPLISRNKAIYNPEIWFAGNGVIRIATNINYLATPMVRSPAINSSYTITVKLLTALTTPLRMYVFGESAGVLRIEKDNQIFASRRDPGASVLSVLEGTSVPTNQRMNANNSAAEINLTGGV